MQKVANFVLSIAIVVSLIITRATPALAVGEITAYGPNTGSTYFGSVEFSAYTNTYTPIANSRTIQITLESDPSITRTITTNLGGFLRQITFDPLANDAAIQSNSSVISITSPDGGAFPNGVYSVTFSWKYSLMGEQTRTVTVSNVGFFASCSAGTFAAIGTTGCTAASLGRYVGSSNQINATLCPAGSTALSVGQSSCDLAPAGYMSAAGTGHVSPSICPQGTFSLAGSAFCTAAQAGYFTSASGSSSEIECQAGTYQPDIGQASCIDADFGHYVPSAHATFQSPCPAGTFQNQSQQTSCINAPAGGFTSSSGATFVETCPAGSYSHAGQTACTLSPANYYVDSAGAIDPTACPASYTSASGSDSIDDCIAPASSSSTTVSQTKSTIAKGKKISGKTLAIQAGLIVTAKSKISLKLAKASKKFCSISGTSVKGKKSGECSVTITVKPKKGSKSVKATLLTVS